MTEALRECPFKPDPMMEPLNAVIETLDGQTAPERVAGGIGISATAGAAVESADLAEQPVKHERPKPVHWDELVEFASTLQVHDADASGTYSIDSVRALRDRLGAFDDDTLEELRYYGIGTLLCGIAKGLQDPERRDRAIRSIGDQLYSAYRLTGTRRRKSLMAADVSGNSLRAVFQRMVKDEFDSYPPHVQLLNDMLSWHGRERESAVGQGVPVNEVIPLPTISGKEEYVAGESIEKVAGLATIATARTIRAVLTMRADYLAEKDPDFPKYPTAVEIMDRTDMDDINLIPVAQRAAAMRMDEMRDLETDYLGMDENGRAVFHNRKLPRSRDLQPPANAPGVIARALLHTRRLRCPALFVEGLIPDMADCIIRGVYEADTTAKSGRRY